MERLTELERNLLLKILEQDELISDMSSYFNWWQEEKTENESLQKRVRELQADNLELQAGILENKLEVSYEENVR